jgi:acetyl-CoA carboxylase biotin carboxyl carrier protein
MTMPLTHDDVQEILSLVESSAFDELKLEFGDLKLELRRSSLSALPRATAHDDAKETEHAKEKVDANGSPRAEKLISPQTDNGLIAVQSPLLGTFYRAPKPGSDPFIKLGDVISPSSVIGIIEVMKLMNPVTVDVAGEVVEIVAVDGELVEHGQVLIRVKPV